MDQASSGVLAQRYEAWGCCAARVPPLLLLQAPIQRRATAWWEPWAPALVEKPLSHLISAAVSNGVKLQSTECNNLWGLAPRRRRGALVTVLRLRTHAQPARASSPPSTPHSLCKLNLPNASPVRAMTGAVFEQILIDSILTLAASEHRGMCASLRLLYKHSWLSSALISITHFCEPCSFPASWRIFGSMSTSMSHWV